MHFFVASFFKEQKDASIFIARFEFFFVACWLGGRIGGRIFVVRSKEDKKKIVFNLFL